MSNSKMNALIKQLDTRSDKTAEKVISELVSLGKVAVPALMKAAKNTNTPLARKWSLEALGAIGDKRAAALLLEALRDDRMTVRLHSLRGLARMKYKKGAKQIAKLLKDKSGGIRVNALYALMEIGDDSVSPEIQKCLADPQWYVRQNACLGCGLFNITKSKAKLTKIVKNDERKAVREAAATALSKMG